MQRRQRRRKPLSIKRQILISICVGLFLGILIVQCLNVRFRPAVIAIATGHLSNQISGQIHDVVNAELEAEGISYNEICTIRCDNSGNIIALQTDMARLSQLKSIITTQVAREFDDEVISETVEIPVGNLLTGLPFSGRGPCISVVVLSVGDISAEFENEFYADGINQTLHRVVLTVTAELRLLLPGGVHTFHDETRMVLAETVLLGDVPDSYFDVN